MILHPNKSKHKHHCNNNMICSCSKSPSYIIIRSTKHNTRLILPQRATIDHRYCIFRSVLVIKVNTNNGTMSPRHTAITMATAENKVNGRHAIDFRACPRPKSRQHAPVHERKMFFLLVLSSCYECKKSVGYARRSQNWIEEKLGVNVQLTTVTMSHSA